MRIVCAGMYRSGSTWLYNVLRLAAEQADENTKSGWSTPELLATKKYVVKVHAFDYELIKLSDMVFSCHRDLRDVVISCHRAFGMPLAIETAREAFSHYATWPYAQYDMKYEDMIKDRPLMATTVAGLAGLKTGPAVLENPLLFHPDSPRETDPTTLLHPLHLGDGRAEIWKNSDFPKKLNQQICSEFSTWMDECGYLV